ncbi:MAG TPA: AAA family ATPase [Pyrinomonadaceae bacterium]|nr:AAA family ATPase [Pyrinomonadaceae bacterium]
MDQALTFVIISVNPTTQKELRGLIGSDGRLRLVTCIENLDEACAELSRLRPSAAIVAVDDEADARFSLIKRLGNELPDTVVICASHDASSDLILRSIRAGAREFLRLPANNEEFATVINRTAEFCAAHNVEPKKLGRTIAVFSNKGGCGNSFIAANLAAAMNEPTALIDLNLQAGDLDLFFGIQPRFSIIDMVENRARLDDSLISAYMAAHSQKLSVLPAPRDTAAAEDITAANVAEVLHVLRQRFNYVIIDPHHTLDSITLAALDNADDILLVSTLDVSAIRSAQRSIEIFDRLGYPRKKVRVIVNRWSKQIDLELQQVERFLGERVIAIVPNDYRAAVNSVNLGRPLVETQPSSVITAEIKRVASLIAAGEVDTGEKNQKGFLGSLFRRNNTPGARLDLSATLNKA